MAGLCARSDIYEDVKNQKRADWHIGVQARADTESAQIGNPSGGAVAVRDVLILAPTCMARSETFFARHIDILGPSAVVAHCVRENPEDFQFPLARLVFIGSKDRYREIKWFRRCERIGAPGLERVSPFELRRLVLLIREVRPAVVYSMFLWNAVDLMDALRLSGVKARFVAHAGGTDLTSVDSRRFEYKRRVCNLLRRADLVTCGSEFLRRKAVALIGEQDNLKTHYLGVTVPSDSEKRVYKSDLVRFIYVGRFVPVKGPEELLWAFSLAVKRSAVPIRLTMVGDGELHGACVRLATALGISDLVIFSGSLPHAVALDEMKRADVYVQFNVSLSNGAQEALGGTILEAEALGLPVLVTESGGTAEAVGDRASSLVGEGQIDDFADRMVMFAESERFREKVGQAGKEYVHLIHNSEVQDRAFIERHILNLV